MIMRFRIGAFMTGCLMTASVIFVIAAADMRRSAKNEMKKELEKTKFELSAAQAKLDLATDIGKMARAESAAALAATLDAADKIDAEDWRNAYLSKQFEIEAQNLSAAIKEMLKVMSDEYKEECEK